MRRRLVRLALAGTLVLGGATGIACDEEDQRDINEIGNEVEEGAEDVGQQVEEGVDKLDDDGKDD